MSEQLQRPRPTITVGGPISEDEIREFMQGTTNQNVGGPTYEQQFGLTSQGPGVQPNPPVAELDVEAARALHTAIQPSFQDANQQAGLEAEIAEWKRQYGNSENEKGALRQSVQDLLAQVKTQQDQFTAMQMMAAQRPQQPPAPSFAPQPTFHDPFDGRDDLEPVSIKDAKRLFNDAMIPVIQATQQQTFAAMDQRDANNKRMQTRLSPMDEQRVLWQNPWINTISNESAKVDAILAQLRSEQLQARITQAANMSPQPGQGQTQNPAVHAVQRTIRQITHTETPASTSSEPTTDAVLAAYQRDMGVASLLPEAGGKRLAALREIAKKYGFQTGANPDTGGMMAGGQTIF